MRAVKTNRRQPGARRTLRRVPAWSLARQTPRAVLWVALAERTSIQNPLADDVLERADYRPDWEHAMPGRKRRIQRA